MHFNNKLTDENRRRREEQRFIQTKLLITEKKRAIVESALVIATTATIVFITVVSNEEAEKTTLAFEKTPKIETTEETTKVTIEKNLLTEICLTSSSGEDEEVSIISVENDSETSMSQVISEMEEKQKKREEEELRKAKAEAEAKKKAEREKILKSQMEAEELRKAEAKAAAEAAKEAEKEKQRETFACVAHEELLLAKIIQLECGNVLEDQICAGSVVLNRVRTTYKDFRNVNTISEVLQQPGQYGYRTRVTIMNCKPGENAKKVAHGLISGEIPCYEEKILFQTTYWESWMNGKLGRVHLPGENQCYAYPLDYEQKCQ